MMKFASLPCLGRYILLGAASVLLLAQGYGQAVRLTGDVPQTVTLNREALATMPRTSLTVDSGGMQVTYEGVWLHEILQKAGLPGGEAIRGKMLATYVVAEASDGYQVVFSYAGLDPAFTEGQVLLADKANGKALGGPDGDFRLVVPKDKRGARSVRMLARLNVVQLRK